MGVKMKKIIGILVCALLVVTLFPISIIAGNSDGPEVEDRIRDVKLFGFLGLVPQFLLKHVDVVAAWFSEDSENPDDLSITLELRDFESQTRMLQAVYVVEWSYNNNHYGVAVHTDPQGIGDFLVGKSEDGDSIFDRWDICYGTHDEDSNTITWTVSKETVGNPPPLSRLTNIQPHTHLRFTTESGLPRMDLLKDLSGNAKSIKDYTVEY